jgi:hypothetical protein
MATIMAYQYGSGGMHDDPLFIKRTPPVDVWVNLAAAYPLPRHRTPFIPRGIDLTASVAARLHSWTVTTTGYWIGWVTYEDRRMKGVTGWVVAAALEERFDQPARRDQSGQQGS